MTPTQAYLTHCKTESGYIGLSKVYIRLNEQLDLIERLTAENVELLSRPYFRCNEENYMKNCENIFAAHKTSATLREAVKFFDNSLIH